MPIMRVAKLLMLISHWCLLIDENENVHKEEKQWWKKTRKANIATQTQSPLKLKVLGGNGGGGWW